jgi:dipeptidyl aminopeptidase/acylaminoacyl peptidase
MGMLHQYLPLRRYSVLLAALMVVGIKHVAPSQANDFSTPVPALSPLSLQAAANVLEVQAPFSSPDGRWVVYTIADPSRTERPAYEQELFTPTGKPLQAGGLRLRVVNLASGRTYEITGKQGSTWSPAWSPDSRYLAFFSDRSGTATLWLWDTATQRQRQLSKAIVHSYIRELPAWSPDSKTVLYKIIPSDMTLLQVLKLNPFYPRARSEPANAEHANVSVYKFAPSMPTASSESTNNSSTSEMIDRLVLSDLALVDVATGKLHRIAKHVHPWPWYAFSPDGTKVAYTQVTAEVSNSARNVSDLDVIWLASGRQKALVQHIVTNFTGGGASWSPDSSRIAYIVANIGGSERSSTLWVLSVGTGAIRKVSGSFDFSSSSYSDLDRLEQLAPLWDANGAYFYSINDVRGTLLKVAADGTGAADIAIPGNWLLATLAAANGRRYWSPDGGRSMLLQLRNTTTHSITFCRFDLGTNQCSAMLDDRKNITLGLGPANELPEALLPYVASDASNPKNVWVTDGGFTFVRQVSKANPEIAAAKLGKLKTVEWNSLAGEHLSGGLLLPANYEEGKRYPLVVAVYGGARGATDTNVFGLYLSGVGGGGFNMQVLASRGFAVLYPEIPIHRERHSPMQDVYQAVIPAIDRVIELGIADSGKVAVMGQSFGGYNTIGLITQTNRFAAAVATSPAWPNLFEGYATFKDGVSMGIGIIEEAQINMGCHPWECRDRYLENSPFFFLDRVTTPLLMERGTDDELSVQNGEIFVGLRRLGKEVTSLEYAHEGHILETPANIVDFWERTLEFLDTHLGVSWLDSRSVLACAPLAIELR